ncbi:hypothetical protein N9937_01240 [bacterium]|nr:hypothetical protein [bacterium]
MRIRIEMTVMLPPETIAAYEKEFGYADDESIRAYLLAEGVNGLERLREKHETGEG